jgi:hypothetical protein
MEEVKINTNPVQPIAVEEKSPKKMVLVIVVGLIFLVIAGYVVFKYQNANLTGNVISVPEKFEFKGYSIIDEAQIKQDCAKIRVFHCTDGTVSKDCTLRGVEAKYEIQGIATKDMKCHANIPDFPTSDDQIFVSTSEANIYKLVFMVDVRQNNDIEVCCSTSSGEKCFPSFSVLGIC